MRKNSTAVCQQQLIALVMHCLLMFGGAAYLRPCGSKLANGFLVASKLGGLLAAVTELEYLLQHDDDGLSASADLTAFFTFLCGLQTVSQVVVAAVLAIRLIAAKLAKRNSKSRLEESAAAGVIVDDDDELLLLNPHFDDGETVAVAVMAQSDSMPSASRLQTSQREEHEGQLEKDEKIEKEIDEGEGARGSDDDDDDDDDFSPIDDVKRMRLLEDIQAGLSGGNAWQKARFR